jgi:hypothetical protein
MQDRIKFLSMACDVAIDEVCAAIKRRDARGAQFWDQQFCRWSDELHRLCSGEDWLLCFQA